MKIVNMIGGTLTLLPLVENRWTRVVETLLFGVCIHLPTGLVDAFLRHFGL